MEAVAGRQHRLKISLMAMSQSQRMEQLRFLITQKTDYVRLQLWTRTEAHIHFRLKCLQKMPLYQLQHLTVTNSWSYAIHWAVCMELTVQMEAKQWHLKSMRIPIFLILMWLERIAISSQVTRCFAMTRQPEKRRTSWPHWLSRSVQMITSFIEIPIPDFRWRLQKRRMITVLFLQIIKEFSTIQQVEQLWRSWYRASRLHWATAVRFFTECICRMRRIFLWQEITEWRVRSTATPTMQTRLPTWIRNSIFMHCRIPIRCVRRSLFSVRSMQIFM